MAINKFSDFYKTVNQSVIFTLDDVKQNPEQYADWLETGDKGAPFAFSNNDTFTLPPIQEMKIWGREEKIGKKRYPMLFTVIHSDKDGFCEVPISIFRRIPYLPSEIEVLKKGNAIGAPLIPRMPDLKRIELLATLVGTKKVRVTEVKLHRAGWDEAANKPIPDSEDKDEKDRLPLVCYRFNLADAE